MMDDKTLRAAGLNEKDRTTLLSQEYPLCMNADDDAYAEFDYKHVPEDNNRLEMVFNYSKDIETLMFGDIVSIAAHEALHSVQVKKLYEIENKYHLKNSPTIVGSAAALLTAFGMGEAGFMLPHAINAVAAGTVTGLLFSKLKDNIEDFNGEKSAHRHEGIFEYMFDRTKKPIEKITQKKDKIEQKISLFSRIKDCLVSGYPSDDLEELFCLQGREIAAKNNMIYDTSYMRQMKKNRYDNIKAERFNIYHIEPQ